MNLYGFNVVELPAITAPPRLSPEGALLRQAIANCDGAKRFATLTDGETIVGLMVDEQFACRVFDEYLRLLSSEPVASPSTPAVKP